MSRVAIDDGSFHVDSSVLYCFFRAKTARNTYSTQEFGSDHWMEPNMVAHGQLRSNPQFEMQENGSKQNLLSPNNEVSENTSLEESCKEMEYYNYLYSNEKK